MDGQKLPTFYPTSLWNEFSVKVIDRTRLKCHIHVQYIHLTILTGKIDVISWHKREKNSFFLDVC